MATFGQEKAETAGYMSQELLVNTNENGIDPDPSGFGNELEDERGAPVSTSTPMHQKNVHIDSTVDSDVRPLIPDKDPDDESEASCGCSYQDDGVQEAERDEMFMKRVMSLGYSRESLMVPGALRVPIVGYETMESRSKFTIYKIHVMMGEEDTGWFVFRRYSDFVQLNDQLRELFPNVRLALPPKRWFRSNFDPTFLQDRKAGLHEFLENVTGHRDICSSQPVRDFFCFDDPPSIHDSLEESRAQCECLEEMLYLLRKELAEKEIEMDLLKEEIDLYKTQVRLLTDRLSEYNKTFCLQEKAALERGNVSLPSLLNPKTLSSDLKTSTTSDQTPDKLGPDFKLLVSDPDNCTGDSSSMATALSKPEPDLSSSAPDLTTLESAVPDHHTSTSDLPEDSAVDRNLSKSAMGKYTEDNDVESVTKGFGEQEASVSTTQDESGINSLACGTESENCLQDDSKCETAKDIPQA